MKKNEFNNEIYFGDNLQVMKEKSFSRYLNKIKMIYIDPPYNTQTNRSYKDNIVSDEWAIFMKDRLKVARTLLKNEGVIFISIDDNEYANLKLICDEVFNKDNFIGTFITKQAQRSNAKLINTIHEYILAYAKNKKLVEPFSIKRTEIPEQNLMINKLYSEIKEIIKNEGYEIANKKLKTIVKDYCYEYNITWLRNYSNVDENGRIYFSVDLSTPGKPRKVNIPEINLKLEPLKTRGWSTDSKFIKLYKEKRLCFKNGRPYSKRYLEEAEDNVPSILNFFSRQGTQDFKKLGIQDIFENPKPVEMLKFLIRITNSNNELFLDFFAGSGSLAQATYEVNEEDNKNNKYILIQLDEEVKQNSNVYKACKKYNVKPNFANILIFRIDKYLNSNSMKKDYYIYNEERLK